MKTTIIILSLIIIGSISFAFAETFEDYITFQIPDNITQTDIRKQIIRMDDSGFEFQITYRFTADQVKQWYDDNLAEYELITVPEEEPTEETPIESNFTPQDKSDELIQYEKDLVRFQEHPPTTSKDIEYLILLEQWKECQRGTGASRGIQDEDTFITSDVIIGGIQAIDRTGSHQKLANAVQACYAQTILESETLGVEAYNKGLFSDSIQPYHADMAHYNPAFWASIPTHETNSLKLTEHAFKAEELTAFDRMCASEFVNSSFKRMQGCVVWYTANISEDGTCRMGMALTEDEKMCILVPTAAKTNGSIDLSNYITDRVDRYNELGDEEQIEKILTQQRMDEAERIKSIWEQR